MVAAIVGGIPTAHELLVEGIEIVAVDLHHAQVAIGLQLGSGELCVGVYRRCLGRIGVDARHGVVAAARYGGQRNHGNHRHSDILIYFFHNGCC